MGTNSEQDTSRAVVQTYVPEYQRDQWDRHADELGMSRSEFVRAMVQAGRRGFGADISEHQTESESESTAGADDESIQEQIVHQIESDGPLSWDELVSAVTGDIEARLEEALESLKEQERVRHSGPAGGYILEDDS